MKRTAFTLLEVMVAIGILSLSLTAIFASESGAMRASSRAQHYHVATLLARCKMGEVEEKVLREGFPAVDARGTDECCEGAEIEGYECEWSIEPVRLPTAATSGDPDDRGGGRSGRSGGDVNDVAGQALGAVGSAGDFLAGGGDRGGLESLLLDIAIPVLTPSIEAQVRRATVEVRWTEGERIRSIDVAQFLVNENATNTEVPLAAPGARR